MDMLMNMETVLKADAYIAEQVGNRLRFYSYDKAIEATEAGAVIIIDPLTPELPTDYADDEVIAEDAIFQVDVWSRDFNLTSSVLKSVKKVLFEAGYRTYGGALNEYDKDNKIYRQAIRLRKKNYTL